MQYKVSVIIPVYNGEDYLHRCFESIQNQSLNEIEIIFVNDGSTDNTASMLNCFAKLDDRVKVISQVNKGTGEARNLGIRNANGHYIAFVDSDDSVDKEMLSELFQKAKFDKDIVVCGHNEVLLNGNVREHLISSDFQASLFFSDVVSLSRPSPVWAKIYHKTLFKNKQCYFSPHTRNNEDNATLLKLLYFSHSVRFVAKPLYNWFRLVGSKSQTINTLRINETINVMVLRKAFLVEQGIFEEYKLPFTKSILRTIKVRFNNILKLTAGAESEVLLRHFYHALYQSNLLSKETLQYLKSNIPTEYWNLIYKVLDDLQTVEQSDFVTLFSQGDVALAEANYGSDGDPRLISLMKNIERNITTNSYVYGVGDTWLEIKKRLPNSFSIKGFIDKKFEQKTVKHNNEFTLSEALLLMDHSSTIVVASLSQVDQIVNEIYQVAKHLDFHPKVITFFDLIIKPKEHMGGVTKVIPDAHHQ